MAFDQPKAIIGYWPAAGNYSSATAQYRLVRLTTSNTVRLTTLVTHVPVGVLQNTPASGAMAEVMIYGFSKVRFGTAHKLISNMSKITASTLGLGFAGHSTNLTRYTLGRCVGGSLTSNTTGIRTILLTHEGGGSALGLTAA